MNIQKMIKNPIVIISAAATVLWQTLTYLAGRTIFEFPDKAEERYGAALTDHAICKVLACVVLFILIRAVLTAVFHRDGNDTFAGVIRCALPYLPVIIAVAAIKLPAGFLTNDEYSIYNDATHLIHDTWFNYMTVYYYIISLMIIPIQYGPIIVKLVMEFFTVGYTVYRSKLYFGKKPGMFMYILFLLYPFMAYTTSAHRLPVYFLIYLLLFSKLIFDLLEKRDATRFALFFMLLAGAVLTQWRTEGIYLLVLVPVLMLFSYPRLRNKRSVAALVLTYIALQYILSVPQNGAMARGIGGAANDRMKPFYAYTITNMYRNGLDRTKNADDLAEVDRYLSLEMMDKINDHYGDINYEDVLILYKEGFVGVREEAGDAEFAAYSDALKRIFMNNPDVFAKTRWGAFCYAALPYHITYTGTGLRDLVSFAISVVKSLSYNLFIPVTVVLVMLIYSLVRRRWFTFFVSGGLMCHWFIVFVLAPASYFKYYFPVYIMAYFYVLAIAIWFFNRKHGIGSPVV